MTPQAPQLSSLQRGLHGDVDRLPSAPPHACTACASRPLRSPGWYPGPAGPSAPLSSLDLVPSPFPSPPQPLPADLRGLGLGLRQAPPNPEATSSLAFGTGSPQLPPSRVHVLKPSRDSSPPEAEAAPSLLADLGHFLGFSDAHLPPAGFIFTIY